MHARCIEARIAAQAYGSIFFQVLLFFKEFINLAEVGFFKVRVEIISENGVSVCKFLFKRGDIDAVRQFDLRLSSVDC